MNYMRRKIRVLYAAFEAVPFMKTGGLGDVAGSLPAALKKNGCEVRVIMPKFGSIDKKYQEKMTFVTSFNVQLGWRNQYCGLFKLNHNGVTFFFLDNEYYFKRDGAYGYFDDGERIAFFSKAIVESIAHLPDFSCDVLHLNDWHTALAAVYLRELYRDDPVYDKIKTVFTVHNLKFQGQFSDAVLGDVLGLDGIPAAANQLRGPNKSINYMQGALRYSDMLTTVSPTYAEEIKTDFFGEKMQYIFRERESILHGILNGIDTVEYDPENDKAIAAGYSADNTAGKAACKAALQKELGLPVEPDTPLVVMIGRLTEQKGLDLLERVLGEILAENKMQIAVLGTGDKKYEDLLRGFAERFDNFSASIFFDPAFSHRMYAGADMLLMPSLFEPCGLSQMIAMRYGTLPVVRETGGLRDSVIPYNKFTGEGTGFGFANYNAHEMMFTLKDAAALYQSDPDAWKKLVKNAMTADFGWDVSAKRHIELYYSLRPDIAPREPKKAEKPPKKAKTAKTTKK